IQKIYNDLNDPLNPPEDFIVDRDDIFFKNDQTNYVPREKFSERKRLFGREKRLDKYFEVPNGGVADNPPIDVLGASAHYKPRGGGKPSAPGIAIYPSLSIIPKPPTPAPPPQCGLRILRAPRIPSRHREIPPVDKTVDSVISDFVPNFPSLNVN
ncbi:8542_t:CDS:2, partial [Funneliformis mosseae]